MSRHTVRPKSSERPKSLKSSLEARRLIRAALKLTGNNQSAAARLLKLPNSAQLYQMLHGTIKDTPAMKLALKRAERRYYNLKRERPNADATLDEQLYELVIETLDDLTKHIKGLRRYEPKNNRSQPVHAGEQPGLQESEHQPDGRVED